jgi:hypothetical protein
MTWRVAKSLEKLRAQINALAPRRSKASDGTIGDAAHAATKSDHNPDADGVVKALDITHDVAGGCNANLIWDSLRAARDPRIQYMIWNRQIVNADQIGGAAPWAVRPYGGSNGHTKHIHISVRAGARRYDDETPWSVQVSAVRPVPAPIPDVDPAPVKPEPPSPIPDIEPTTPRPPAPAVTGTDALGGAVAVAAISVGAWLWNALGWVGLAVIVCGVLAGVITYANRKKRSA